MQLIMSCPRCSKGAILTLDDDEVESVKEAIVEKGRSPTLLARCESGHELIVTLYVRDGELGVRDIAVPLDSKRDEKEPEKAKSELDWVKDVFGG